MNENFENFLPEDLNIGDSSERKSIADSVRNFYLDGKELTKDSLLEYAKVIIAWIHIHIYICILLIIHRLEKNFHRFIDF